MMRAVKPIVLVATLALAACDQAPEAQAGTPPTFKPEQLVQFSGKGFSCESRDAFVEAITHSVSGEKTLFARMFNDGRCSQLSTTSTMKVLRVERTMLEVAAIGSDAQSVWTAPEFVISKPVDNGAAGSNPVEMSKP